MTGRCLIITDSLGRTHAVETDDHAMRLQFQGDADAQVIERAARKIEAGEPLLTEHGIICFSPRHVVSIHWGVR